MRLTYLNRATGRYSLINGQLNEDALIQALGLLEEFKQDHEINTLADYIKDIRKRLGLNQYQFSKLIHIPPTSVSNYESGKCTPSLLFWQNLAIHAKIPMHEASMIYAKAEYQIDRDTFSRLALGVYSHSEAMKIIGLFLRSEREFYHIKKPDLAKAMGITSNRITRIESGLGDLASIHIELFASRYKTLGADITNLHRLAMILSPDKQMRWLDEC